MINREQTPSREARTTLSALCANVAELLVAFASSTSAQVAVCQFDDGRYVQFWASRDVAVAEVVANEFLEPSERLTWLQERELVARGWRAPGEQSPNWYFESRGADAHLAVARATVEALTRVLGYRGSALNLGVVVTSFAGSSSAN